jgi:uncharacterized protein YcbX
MLEVSELFIYPVKSLGGIPVNSATITDRGFQYDRRWMLVDANNCFLTQREFPQMALLQVDFFDGGFIVHHKIKKSQPAIISNSVFSNEGATAEVWSDKCRVQFVSRMLDEWFSDILSLQCRLVYMPDVSRRRVDSRYALNKEITSLSDGYPFLIIGQSSLDDLNGRLAEPLPINRFRPNIVFTGGEPYMEDRMESFSINDIQFFGVKLCGRCTITTISQENATRAAEPLKTLSTYRKKNSKIYFGQNLLHEGDGEIHVGDVINIHQLKEARLKI